MPPAATPELPHARSAIAAAADQCVMCGLCLPHCPSYRVARTEGESPRGRIAYSRGLATGTMAATPAMLANLDDCLACGVCEAVCPSQVRYMDIIVATRAALEAPRQEPPWRRRLRRAARRPALWRILQRFARPASRLGLARRLARLVPRWQPLLEQWRGMPAPAAAPPAFTPAGGPRRGALALFRGCAAAALDADTHAATVAVLSRLGYDVHAPTRSGCCGALERHAGDVDTAARLARDAGASLRALEVDAVLGSASGCQHSLATQVLGPGDPPCWDIMAFLAQDSGFARIALSPMRRHVALQVPCTERGRDAATLLARIPGLQLSLLPQQPRCCGAAGLYFMDHPAIAEPLRNERIEQIRALAPEVVFTTNIGCRLYLGAGLQARGLAIPVRHPITLLAEAMT